MSVSFDQLLPKVLLDAVFAQGMRPTGVLFPLNSYENRVYQIALEESDPIIAKFYRPGRWSPEAIDEEHRFVRTLAESKIPVVEALALQKSLPGISTLAETEGFYYSFFPKFRGREHDEVSNEDRRQLGGVLARLHLVGEKFPLKHRLTLNPETYGYQSLDFILDQSFIPKDLRDALEGMLVQSLEMLSPFFEDEHEWIAVHGDCHPGNVLWSPHGPTLLDFDDMILAPPVQDFWMLFNGDAEEIWRQRQAFFEGYRGFRSIDEASLVLGEPLRTLRMIRYAAWIGQRYEEAAFQRAFPYYRERRYWEEFLLSIKEQIAVLQDHE